MDASQFLTWVASGGGAAIVLAFVLQRWAWYEAQPKGRKEAIALFGSIGLALAAYAYPTLAPADVQAALLPWLQIAYGVAAAWVANQVGHKADPLQGRGKGDA